MLDWFRSAEDRDADADAGPAPVHPQPIDPAETAASPPPGVAADDVRQQVDDVSPVAAEDPIGVTPPPAAGLAPATDRVADGSAADAEPTERSRPDAEATQVSRPDAAAIGGGGADARGTDRNSGGTGTTDGSRLDAGVTDRSSSGPERADDRPASGPDHPSSTEDTTAGPPRDPGPRSPVARGGPRAPAPERTGPPMSREASDAAATGNDIHRAPGPDDASPPDAAPREPGGQDTEPATPVPSAASETSSVSEGIPPIPSTGGPPFEATDPTDPSTTTPPSDQQRLEEITRRLETGGPPAPPGAGGAGTPREQSSVRSEDRGGDRARTHPRGPRPQEPPALDPDDERDAGRTDPPATSHPQAHPQAPGTPTLEAMADDLVTRDAVVVCIANQKGGVGKTTTAVSLAAALAEAGAQVLLVDLDPQGNATTGLGLRVHEGQPSSYTVLVEEMAIEDAVEPTAVRGLHLLPSSLDLAGAEIELVPAFSRELRLKRALDAARDLYDIVIVDCPPTLGLLTVNALAAADEVLLPIQCEYYALEGVGQLTRSVEMVRRSLNPDLRVGGVLLTMFDARTRLAQQVVDEVREHFGSVVYRTVVPRTVRLSEAPGFGQPITTFDPSSRGARAYLRLADEVAERLGLDVRTLSPLDRLIGPAADDDGGRP